MKKQDTFSSNSLKSFIIILAISSFIFTTPLIVKSFDSYIYLLLLALFIPVMIYIIKSFGEFESSYLSSKGGIYEYFKVSYNRYTGYVCATLLFFSASYILIRWIYSSLSFFLSWQGAIAFTILIILILNCLIYFKNKAILYLNYVIGVILVILVLYLAIICIINYQVTLPDTKITSNILDFWLHISLTIALLTFPLSFILPETKEAEENITEIVKFRKIAASGIFIFALLYLGIIQQTSQPFYGTIENMFPILSSMIPLIASIALSSIWFFALSRLIEQVSKDGLFFQKFKKRQDTPKPAIVLQTFLLVLIALAQVFQEDILFTLSATSLVIMSWFILPALVFSRIKEPDLERPYSIKHWKLNSSLLVPFILFFIFWTTQNPTSLLLIPIALILFIPYFLFEMYFNEKMVEKAGDFLATIDKLDLRRIFLPKKLRDDLIKRLGNLKGKKVLEYGCKTGRITIPLIGRVGREGKVYATDKSRKALNILNQKIERKGFLGIGFKVHLLKDFPSSINPAVSKVDCIISTGTLSGIKNVDNVLKEMNILMPVSGHIVIMDFNKLFGFFPNKWLADDDSIKDYFDRNGFGVSIERKRHLFWEHVIITGIKFKDAYYLDTWYENK